jgi:DNA repair photolyase
MEYQLIECKTLLHHHDTGYLPYHWDVNIYRGCAHSCPYCFARYSHEYLGYRDPFDFEQRILVKVNAPEILDRELASPKWRGELVNLSGVSDPYQPAEKKFGLTRQVLEVMLKHRNPTILGTKSDLILRDLDLLSRLSKTTFCCVAVTITTLNEGLRKQLEPFSPPTSRRVALLKKLKEAGVKTGLLATPIFPYLTDNQRSLEDLVRTTAECEVDFFVAGVLSLKPSARQRFLPFLRQQFPGLYSKYHQLYKGWSAPKEYSRGVYERVWLLQEKYGVRHNIQWPQGTGPQMRQMSLFEGMYANIEGASAG